MGEGCRGDEGRGGSWGMRRGGSRGRGEGEQEDDKIIALFMPSLQTIIIN